MPQTLDQIFKPATAPTGPVERPSGNAPTQSLDSIFGATNKSARPSLDSIFNAPTPKTPEREYGIQNAPGIHNPTVQPELQAKNTAVVKENLSGLGSDLKQRASDIADTFSSSMNGKMESTGSAFEKGAHIAAEATGVINDIFSRGFKTLTEILANDPHIQKIAQAGGNQLDYVNGAIEQGKKEVSGSLSASPAGKKLAAWAEAHPHVANTLKDLAKTAGNISLVEAGPEAKSITGGLAREGAGLIGKGVDATLAEGKALAGDIKTVTAPATEKIGAIKDKLIPSKPSIDEVVGQIIQGKPEDIAPATKTLTQLDTAGIKTQEDLYNALDQRVKDLSKAQDANLAREPRYNEKPLLLKQWDKISQVGDRTISHNYVEDGLNQLKNHYAKVNDVENATRISQLIEHANTEGLTVKEVNDIAREHGSVLNAFNANGELASGLTKQAVENTRSGIKATAREALGDESYKAIDSAIADTITTRDLIKDQVDAVNKLEQKIKTRTWGEQLGRFVGQAVNLLGANSPKGLVEYFLGRGTGLKTLNALDLQEMLNSNLRKLKELNQTSSPTEFESMIKSLIEDNQERSINSRNRGENSDKNLAVNQSTRAKTPNSATASNALPIKTNTASTKPIMNDITTFEPKSKTLKYIIDYVKNPRLGLSVGDITAKIPQAIRAEAADLHSVLQKLSAKDFVTESGKVNMGVYEDVDNFLSKFESSPEKLTKEDIINAREALGIIKGV